MISPWLLGSVLGIGAACVLAYLLGRWHGLEAALSYRFPDQVPGHWPAALQGDLPNLSVHARGVNDA